MAPRVVHGGCMEEMRRFAAEGARFDACVTDPPYELSFMGRAWDGTGIAFQPETWRAVYDALKPGAHLLAFGGTRTFHRMAVAIEDAGFELRDTMMWLYGSGFPKSLDVSKAIDKAAGATREVVGRSARNLPKTKFDGLNGGAFREKPGMGEFITVPATDAAKQWTGWGTALKPAWEPIIVARKPLDGTVAANVLAHGCGGINIDACRVPAEGRPAREVAPLRDGVDYRPNSLAGRVDGSLASSKAVGAADLGRWPANVLHDGSGEVEAAFAAFATHGNSARKAKGAGMGYHGADGERGAAGYDDSGTASRFFYCAKASKADRAGSKHPTVKPISLMRHLVRLVTPPGGVVLDPFAGSGTTLEVAAREGFGAVGIEREEEYVADIRRRLAALEAAGTTAAAASVHPDLFLSAAD